MILVAAIIAPGPVRAQTTSTPCSPQQLSDEATVIGSGVNSTQAIHVALTSPGYQALAVTIPVSIHISFNSIFDLWGIDSVTCTPVLQSVNVVLNFHYGSSEDSLTLSVAPDLQDVTNITLQPTPMNHTAEGLWSGYWFGQPPPIIPLISSIWWVPLVEAPSNHCNANLLAPGWCVISTWVGLTPAADGTTGIAQTGTDQSVECHDDITYFYCSSTYEGWYQYYPQFSNNCLSVSPGDEIHGEVVFTIPNYWSTGLWDISSGQGCTSSITARVGFFADYSEFIVENPPVPILGGNYPTPVFAPITFSEMVVLGDPANLVGVKGESSENDASNIAMGNLVYNGGGGTCHDWTCYTDIYRS